MYSRSSWDLQYSWDYRHALPWPVYAFPGIEAQVPRIPGKHSITCTGIILSTEHMSLSVTMPWADLSHLQQNFYTLGLFFSGFKSANLQKIILYIPKPICQLSAPSRMDLTVCCRLV